MKASKQACKQTQQLKKKKKEEDEAGLIEFPSCLVAFCAEKGGWGGQAGKWGQKIGPKKAPKEGVVGPKTHQHILTEVQRL